MIVFQNNFTFLYVAFYVLLILLTSLNFSLRYFSMHRIREREITLTSIPEREEIYEPSRWVPKKKHEVLVAKYKCLKKLFQIYDASIIGAINDNNTEETDLVSEEKCESYKIKSDACAATSDLRICSETSMKFNVNKKDINVESECNKKESNFNCTCQCKLPSETKFNNEQIMKECGFTQTQEFDQPHESDNKKPRLTKFQIFVSRLFGIKPQNNAYMMPSNHIIAASENNIINNFGKRRRKRGIILRRRRPKKVQSESVLQNYENDILNYVHSVQRNCLLDTTVRQCPIMGCNNKFYGKEDYITTYNIIIIIYTILK